MSDWAEHAIWWHVYPLGFLGAERDALPPGAPPVDRLSGLARWFDYLIGLGCNGLALGPVFASRTHGYDTVDHFRVDPRLGAEADLVRLIEQARERGVRVLLDGVFNHVGRDFPAFAEVAAHGPASRYADWFTATEDGFATFEGHHGLVALNHANPEVADYVVDVLTYWLERGAAGWRLDAAYAVPRPFWAEVSGRVRARFPDAWLMGEVIHGDYGAYAREGGLDSVTQYELWKAIWSSFNDRNLFELAWALKRHNAVLDDLVPYTFVGNHDVTRLASRLDDRRLLPHALVVLFTIGGVPSVYAGDEQAFEGVKEEREGGDDAVRPAFPGDPGHLARPDWEHYRLHQVLIGLRRRHPWLTRARTTMVELTSTAAVYTVADAAGELTVALNLAGEPAGLALPAGRRVPLAGEGELGDASVRLPPYGWLIAGAAS